METPAPITVRTSRWHTVLGLLIACLFIASGIWIGGFTGWLVAAGAGALGASGLYQLARKPRRLTLSEQGIAWSRRNLAWTEVRTMRELRWGYWPTRRILAITTVGGTGTRPDQILFRSDFTINITALERSADEILGLVERFSGQIVRSR